MCKMKSVKKLVICAVCIALCCVLPIAFHAFNLGVTFSPMHIPVLLCGLLCGGSYGLCCGLVGPLLSSLVSGMPGPMGLVTMVPELMAYGLSAGLLMKVVRTKNTYAGDKRGRAYRFSALVHVRDHGDGGCGADYSQ